MIITPIQSPPTIIYGEHRQKFSHPSPEVRSKKINVHMHTVGFVSDRRVGRAKAAAGI